MNVVTGIDHVARANALPLDQFDVSDPKLFQDDV